MTSFSVTAISVIHLPGELGTRTIRRKGETIEVPHRQIIQHLPGVTFTVGADLLDELKSLNAIDLNSIVEVPDDAPAKAAKPAKAPRGSKKAPAPAPVVETTETTEEPEGDAESEGSEMI